MSEKWLSFDDWINAELKQAHLVAGRANALADEMIETLEEARGEIIARLALLQNQYLKGETWENETARNKAAYLEAQRDAINGIMEEIYSKMREPLEEAASNVIHTSLETTMSGLGLPAVVSYGTTAQILKEWIETQTVEGLLINEWLERLGASNAERIIKAGRIGLINGYGVRKVAAMIRKEGVEMATPGLEAVARTFLHSAANYSRDKAIKDSLGPLLKGWQYTAILDGRTCLICGANDGKIYRADEPRPNLPRHINCRCLFLPVIKSYRELGLDIDDLEKAERNALKHDERVEKNEDGSRSTRFKIRESSTCGGNYEEWLKSQLDDDPAFVRKVLGKTRFELFRAGKLSLNKMVVNERIARL